MKRNDKGVSLQNDTRAVAPLIGFILLFGFLVIAFIGYQAQVVPQQNAETEFEHFQQNQNELIELRSAILTAGTSDRQQFPTIQLGTNYQTRLFALNGPPPAGILQTSDSYPITISDGDDETDDVVVDTRFLEYQPGYYEIDIGSTWYENSVLYLDETESSGNRVIIEDQSLVDKGTLQITALQNEFQQSGTGRITLELKTLNGNNIGNLSDLNNEGKLTVELPTRLDEDYWVGQFEESSVVDTTGFDPEPEYEPDINEIELEVDNVTVNTVGISDEPTEDLAKNIDSTTTRGPILDTGPVCQAGDRTINADTDENIAVNGDVTINSQLDGDITAGGEVTVNSAGRVNGNIQAGGRVIINSGGRVAGNIESGEQVNNRGGTVDGSIDRNINGYSPCSN